ncbi:MAG: 4Fe-4S binding protein [Candidatus Cloacimonetes bacterium]|nr:4Fe-4S binding protein [Candidatus Cloacimonadota bacterium]MDD4147910.1 4Fe-4S binding protein [Candidatus Cloacimonadota bacterium]MDD4559443.1 4Fe-4S binding protein [Candidatus Cloacimonadota bacterium]
MAKKTRRSLIMAVKIDKETCIGCGACVDVCPVSALSLVDGKADCDEGTCIDCGACIATCPVSAISE